ncbi:MAG: DUF2634 domain-containing protein [Negativicutes bacterium]|nr:DUF2634 domain-containing protein [Negativicutes bacterium]
MSLIPTSIPGGLDTAVNITTYPSYTYFVNRDTGRIVGMIDTGDAMLQAIVKILWTERYFWMIYSWNYGIEINSLVGKDPGYTTSEAKRRITEALIADDRVNSVTDFVFYQAEEDDMTVTFNVNTIYGTYPMTGEVMV